MATTGKHETDSLPTGLETLLEPLKSAYLRLSFEDRNRIDQSEAIEACIALLTEAARTDGRTRLVRSLRLCCSQDALERLSGGLLGLDEFASMTGLERDVIAKWAREGLLLEVSEIGRPAYPLSQLDSHGQLMPGLSDVLKTLASQGISGWMALDVMHSPSPKFAASPIELLSQGRRMDALECAEALREQGTA